MTKSQKSDPVGDKTGGPVIVGRSQAMRRVYRQIDQVAALPVTVLITGESGTGKELVAWRIHRKSRRSDGPFIPVNMGAVARDLVESELFGHEKGAFTGAAYQHKGKFETASGGTLFLDEISTMTEKLQVSLLRVLETMEFQRVGGQRSRKADLRLLAATNGDLRKDIEERRFREDLYHRLNVFNIHIPPLRERGDDIVLLAEHFLERYADELESPAESLSSEVLALLKGYSWPGNVRELENTMIRAVVMTRDPTVTPEALPDALRGEAEDSETITLSVGQTLDEAEREIIARTLDAVRGNKSKAASILGLSRKAIYNKLRHLTL